MIRKATKDDIPALVKIGKEMHAETRYAAFSFDEVKVKSLFDVIIADEALGFCLVAEDGEYNIHGGILAFVGEFYFSRDKYISEYGLFLSAKHRGARTAASLLQAYIVEAGKYDVKEIAVSNSTGNIGKVEKLYEYCGFTCNGSNWSRPL